MDGTFCERSDVVSGSEEIQAATKKSQQICEAVKRETQSSRVDGMLASVAIENRSTGID